MKKKNILCYILAFLIPIIVISIVFMILNVFIFSDKNFMVSDMQAQYYPLFSYYKNVFNGNESLFYTFNSGLGNSMLSTFTYYLASPLNLILILFNNLHIGIIVLMILKIGLSGFTMYIFLNKKINGRKIYTLMFSTCYALMAYNICYCFNIMWLDAVILAPLVLLGIDKLIKGKPLLFIITLFITVLSNYYIAYMVCIFSAIYIIYSLFMKYNFKKDKKIMIKTFLKFVLLGILSVLLASFILIPALIQLTNSNKEILNHTQNIFEIIENILGIINKTFIGTHYSSNVLCQDNVNVYCGIIILPLLFFYLINKKISKKEKIGFIIILAIFIIGICFKITNILWHGMSLPQCFNFRYSFLFILYFIYIAYKSLMKIDGVKKKYYIIFLILYIIMAISSLLFGNIQYENYFIYISIGMMILYLLLIYNLKSNNNDVVILLIFLTLGELLFNAFVSYRYYNFNFNETYTIYETYMKQNIDKYNDKNDFYRIEKAQSFTANDSLLLSYKGVNHFLSSTNGKVIDFLKHLGLEGNNLNIEYSSDSKIIDSFLGIKYIMDDDNDIKYYNQINKIEINNKKALKKKSNYYVYENDNYLSIGYMVDNKIKNYNYTNMNNYEYQNYIFNLLTNNCLSYFEEVNVIKDEGYKINKDYDGYTYLYLMFNKKDDDIISLKFNGDTYANIKKNETILRIPYENEYEITFILNDKEFKDVKMSAYKFNNDTFSETIKELQSNQLNVTKSKHDVIEGNIDSKKDGIFFTTIPYEKGWNIYVDDKKIEYDKYLDTFIGFELNKGKHNIKFKYETPYLKTGITISISSFIALLLYLIINKKIDNKQIN